MKPLLWTLLALTPLGCNTPTFDLVTTKPNLGWVDGCTEVRVSGAVFAQDATLTIGGVKVDVLARGEGADLGYWMNAYTPQAPTGAAGYVDVTVTSAGSSLTLPQAYYYTACPAPGWTEDVFLTSSVASPLDPWTYNTPSHTLAANDAVTVIGCQLDFSTMKVQLMSPDVDRQSSTLLDATSDCGTGKGHFTAPAMADGGYDVVITDSAGTIVYPPDYGCIAAAAAAGDTAASCYPVSTVCFGEGC